MKSVNQPGSTGVGREWRAEVERSESGIGENPHVVTLRSPRSEIDDKQRGAHKELTITPNRHQTATTSRD